MSLHRSRLLYSLLATLLVAATARAEKPVRIPTENTIEDLQFFAPVESNGMSDRPYLKEGFFFGWDHVYWSVSRPANALIGVPGPQDVFNTNTFQVQDTFSNIDTSDFEDTTTAGNRWEVGHLYDSCGWMLGMTDMYDFNQRMVHNDATVLFDDPRNLVSRAFVPSQRPGVIGDADIDGDQIHGRSGQDIGTRVTVPSATFPFFQVITVFNGTAQPRNFPNGDRPDLDDLVAVKRQFVQTEVTNHTEIWSAEAMAVRRLDRFVMMGHVDVFGGVRYQDFEEDFMFRGFGQPGSLRPILDDTKITSEANNNIIGPQIGFRWFRSCCRGTFSTEVRFAPAVNLQSVRMRTMIAGQVDRRTDLNPVTGTATNQDGQTALTFENAGNDSLHAYKFSPVGELRLNYSYQVTRAIAVRAGWTATYVGGLARPSNMVIYQIPDPQIKKTNYLDDLFMQGVNVGVEINR